MLRLCLPPPVVLHARAGWFTTVRFFPLLALQCSAFAPGPAVPFPEESGVGPESGPGAESGAGAESGSDVQTAEASTIPPGPSLNGCAQASYVDRSGASADRTVYFGGAGTSGAYAYSPACILVAAGQTVTFSGDFTMHPLSAGSSPNALTSGTSGNPIQPYSSPGGTLTVTFPSSGTFPYFCQNHYSIGMLGAVRVR